MADSSRLHGRIKSPKLDYSILSKFISKPKLDSKSVALKKRVKGGQVQSSINKRLK